MPADQVKCIGEQKWIINDYRCYEDNGVSYITTFCCSLLFGFFGVDRFFLGYPLLGTIKLLTFGGIGIWYIIDLLMIASGSLRPNMGDSYINSY